MVDIEQWMKNYQEEVIHLFGKRVLFIGLQGSYGRNEASEGSDIDVVLILDAVSIQDLAQYKKILSPLPHRDRICGFVSGKREIKGWCKSDLFQFYYDTTAYYGSLEDLIPPLTEKDARDAVLMGACSLYHMCSHNFVHSNSLKTMRALYKSAIFVLQAKYYCENGKYIKSHSSLRENLTGMDFEVIQCAEQVRNIDPTEIEMDHFSDILLQWTGMLICQFK